MNFQRSLAARATRRIRLLQNLSFAVLAAGALLPSPFARGATDTFIGNGVGPLFSTGFNPTPQNGDTLVFGVPGLGGTTVTDDIASLTVGGANTDGIDFTAAAAGYTINASGGAVLTLGSSGTGVGINDLSINAQTINVPLTLASSQTLNVGNRAGSLTLSGVISDGGSGFGLTKTGSGLLTLSGANTFTGTVTVSGGVLAISADGTGTAQQLGSGATASSLVLDGGTLRTTAATTISVNRTILLGDAGAGTGGTIDTNGQASGFNGVMANNGGANSFTKTGAGTFTLGGANTYTGNTVVNQGTLNLDFSQAGAPAANIVNAGSRLVFNNVSTAVPTLTSNPNTLNVVAPTLNVTSGSGVNSVQTFNGVQFGTVAAGGLPALGSTATISTTQTGGGNVLLNLGALTHNAGGTVNFAQGGATVNGVNAINTTTANTNGILGGWATVGTGVAQAASDYAAVDANGNIVAYSAYTVAGTASGYGTAAAPTIASDGTRNVLLNDASGTAALTLAAAGTTDVNTLKVARTFAANGGNTNNSIGTTINLQNAGTNGVLRLGTQGGILNNQQGAGSADIFIQNGTLTAGGPVLGTPGEITFNNQGMNGINNGFYVSSVIANNNAATGAANSTGGGAVTVTFTGGNGTQNVLSGVNTYSGGTFVLAGRVYGPNSSSFGTGAVTVLPGGEVIPSATTANNFFIQGTGYTSENFGAIRNFGTLTGTVTLLGDASISGGSYNGQITGAGNVTILNNGGGNTIFGNATANLNNWTGNTLLASNLSLGASEQIPDGAAAGNLNVGGNTFDLRGFNETINGLTGTATAGQGTVQNSVAGASVFTVGGNDQSFTYNGALRNSTGTLALVKTGAGVAILGNNTTSNQSNYSGGTTVNGGTLRFATAGMTGTPLGSANGVLTVNGGATAGGTLDLNGNNLTVGGLSGAAGAVPGLITSTGTGAVTLTVNNNTGTGGLGTATAYAGTLQNGSAASLGLTLPSANTATLDLTGMKTYTGSTNVGGGSLQIGGSPLNSASATTLSGTGGLVLGDGAGPVSQTLNSLTTVSGSTVTGGSAANSTLTLNGTGTAAFANVFGGAGTNQNNLNLVIAGTGTTPTTVLTGVSTYTGTTTVNGGSTLNLIGGSIGGSALTLNSGGTLTGSGNNSTTGLIGSVTASGGSAITLAGASGTALRSTGGITLGGTGTYGAGVYTTLNYTLAGAGAVESLNTPVALTLNSGGVYVNVTNPTTAGSYTLANYGSLTGAGGFSLSSTTAGVTNLSLGRNTESLTVNATSLVLTIAGTPTPGVAFFNGAVSNVFNDTTTSTTLVNFSTNQAGTTDAGNVPGANTDVVLVANNATNAAHRNTANIVTTLGASTTINSLNALSAATPGLASFTINADGSTLTINGNADNNTATGGGFTGNTAGNAIRLAAGAAPLTVNTPVVLGGGNNLTITNNSSNALTMGGTVTGSAATGNTQTLTLTNNGTGGTTINGVIANSAVGSLALVVNNPGTGVTTLGATNTYSGGTTLNAGTLTATAAGGLGTGNVTVDANDNNFDDATLNTNGSIAATAAVIVNSTTGNGTVNFNGTTPAVGSLTGNGNVVLNNPGGTTLTVGNTANNLSSNFSGPISGTGSLVTAGTGTVVLSGTNTYSGSTTVSGGILQLGSAAALPANTLNGGANLVINTGSTLDLNSNSTALAAIPTGTGGTITDTSANTSTLTLGGGGTLAQTLTGNLALAVPSGSLVLNNVNGYTGGTTISGAGTMVTANSMSLGANAAGSNVAIGSGSALVLQSPNNDYVYSNTFSGSGLLKITSPNGGGGTTINNFGVFSGTLEIATTGTNKVQIQTANPTNLSTATLLIDNGGQYISGGNTNFGTINLQGTGNDENRGAIRLNGNGTTSGVIGGNLVLQGNTTIGNEGGALTGNISPGVTGLLTLTMGTTNSNGNATLSGNLTDGSGQLALVQAFGTTTLTGTASTYTGGTTVTGGTLLVNGNTSAATGAVAVTGILGGTGSVGGPTTVNAGGRITGGTIGGISTLTLANTLTINGTYLVDIAAGNNQSDRLTLSGTGANGLLTLATGSTLTLSTTTLDGTSRYVLASYASLSGTFTTTNVPTGYTLVYGGTELDLVPSASVPEPSTLAAAFLGLGALSLSWSRRRKTPVAASYSAV